MELNEMQNIWKSYMDTNISLNTELLSRLNFIKEKSKLNKRIFRLAFELIVHIFIIVLLANYIEGTISELKYVVPAFILLLFTIASSLTCIGQAVSILQMNYGEPIASLQEKIMKSNLHMIQYAKIGLLSIPFYLCYAIIGFKVAGVDIYSLLSKDWWIYNIIFTLILLDISVRISRKINYKNINKHWVRKLVEIMGGKKMVDEMNFLKELEEFKKD